MKICFFCDYQSFLKSNNKKSQEILLDMFWFTSNSSQKHTKAQSKGLRNIVDTLFKKDNSFVFKRFLIVFCILKLSLGFENFALVLIFCEVAYINLKLYSTSSIMIWNCLLYSEKKIELASLKEISSTKAFVFGCISQLLNNEKLQEWMKQ